VTTATVPKGAIITFYSYKGGTGRSMALANVACLMAKRLGNPSQRVLVMDWDLEAPGLHRFFAKQTESLQNVYRPGVIDYFGALHRTLKQNRDLYQDINSTNDWNLLDRMLPLDDYIVRDVVMGVDLVKAGRLNTDYAELVGTFNWVEFYNNCGWVIDTFKQLLASRYAFTLIDSRTGFSDVSGICTMLLPEKLVTVFTPNRQSLSGVVDLVGRATEYRRASNDFRPLAIFPLPSRIENAERDLKVEWRAQYQREFEETFSQIYQIGKCELTDYFDKVQLPYQPYYAYGEKIAVIEERADALSLNHAYQLFFQRLVDLDFAWDVLETIDNSASADSVIRSEYFQKKYDVFFSYDHADVQAVSTIAARLKSYNVQEFFAEQDILPGENVEEAFNTAIRMSSTVAVFIGSNGIDTKRQTQILSEVAAIDRDPNRRIIPVLLPGTNSSSVPDFLRKVSWVDFNRGLDDEDAFRRLLSGITGRKLEEIGMLAHERTGGTQQVIESRVSTPHEAHFRRVVQNIIDGRLVPFLGPGINLVSRHPTLNWRPKESKFPPTSGELASFLAQSFEYPHKDEQDLARVAQFVSLMIGSAPLYEELHDVFDVDFHPTELHHFFANLPSTLREKGYPFRHQLIVTTNYDDVLERAFKTAGEPFDLVSYLAEGEFRGKFVHRTSDGEEKLIERPNEYRGVSLEGRATILKIHGAVNRELPDQDSYMITEDDHVDYLSGLDPTSQIPVTLAAMLRRSHFLFLGYSLREWTLRAILQSIRGGHRLTYESWAIQPGSTNLDERFWARRDVEMLNLRLDDYINMLWEKCKELPRRA
jgi:cellulose biosynthesis protein BcsQ